MKKYMFMGIFSMMLMFLFTGCPGADDDGGGTNTGGDNNKKDITVYVKKPAEWSKVYAYIWDDNGNEYTEKRPGTELSEGEDGFYSFKSSAEYGYINVRFNDGDTKQGVDLLDVETDTYYQKADYSTDSLLLFNAGSSSAITAAKPEFKASEVTDSTVTLMWSPIPGADGYVMYDLFENEETGDEYWHFQKILSIQDTSFYDDNYGLYLDPKGTYTWKLAAVKYKADADFSALDKMDPDAITEFDYSPSYTLLYNFGGLEVTTKESSLSKPIGLQVVSTSSTGFKVKWNEVLGATGYEVYFQDPYFGERWMYWEDVYTTTYEDEDEDYYDPDTTYSFYIIAWNERTFSEKSDKLQIPIRPAGAAGSIGSIPRSIGSIPRAATPGVPEGVSAKPHTGKAETVTVSWNSLGNGIKYEIGIFKNSDDKESIWSIKESSKSTKDLDRNKFKGDLGDQLDFYVAVRSVKSDKNKSDWSERVPATVFPTGMGFGNSGFLKRPKPTNTVTITMKNVWLNKLKTDKWDYGYTIKYTDTGTDKKDDIPNSYSKVISDVPATSKAKVEVTPYLSIKGTDQKYLFSGTYKK